MGRPPVGSSHTHTRLALPWLNNDGPPLLAHSLGHAKLCPRWWSQLTSGNRYGYASEKSHRISF